MNARANKKASADATAREIQSLLQHLWRVMESNDRFTCTCYGVTALQGMLLIRLFWKQPLSMQELAAEMRLTLSTISRVVDKLVAAGLINRDEHKDDRRMVQCTLSAAGTETVRKLEDCYGLFFTRLVDKIPPKDLQGFLSGLRTLLKEMENPGGRCGT